MLETLKFNGKDFEELIWDTYDEFIGEIEKLKYEARYIRYASRWALYEIENEVGDCKLIWVKFLEDEEL